MHIVAFTPALGGGTTQTLSGTSTSSRVALSPTPVPNIHVYNAGSATVYLQAGPSTVTAAPSTGFPVPSGGVHIFGISRQSYIAGACSAGGSATVYITPGEGGL